jgi:putative SOS response-associated peptidase YedK
MCGRFALATEKNILDMLYDLEIRTGFNLAPRYNIAPSQQVPVMRLSPADGSREMALLKWGLVPFWADDPAIGNKMINARAETVADKPSFRDAFKKRRALVPASGFYEWKKIEGVKQPYYITRKDNKPFSLAGLWEIWNKGSEPLETFTILTTEPNTIIAELHNRMPVIIPHEAYKLWLDPATDQNTLKKLLVPYPEDELTLYPVSRLINSPANDSSGLIEPL